MIPEYLPAGRKIAAFAKKQTILCRATRPMLFFIYRKAKQ
jgi:hypothetical protein